MGFSGDTDEHTHHLRQRTSAIGVDAVCSAIVEGGGGVDDALLMGN